MKAPWIAVLLAAAAVAHAQPAADVEQPRGYGRTLGDVLTQRIRLDVPGAAFQPRALPPLGRIDGWLARQSAVLETDRAGARWLRIDYQLVNAPAALAVISLPALSLTAADGSLRTVPAWPVSVAPLTPRSVPGSGDLTALRPERLVALPAAAPLERDLRALLGALAGVLAAWAGWALWRQRRDTRRLPFARAWQRLRGVSSRPSANDWVCLHHALNDAAGHAVHAHSLARAAAALP
jgi:mxaA protein